MNSLLILSSLIARGPNYAKILMDTNCIYEASPLLRSMSVAIFRVLGGVPLILDEMVLALRLSILLGCGAMPWSALSVKMCTSGKVGAPSSQKMPK